MSAFVCTVLKKMTDHCALWSPDALLSLTLCSHARGFFFPFILFQRKAAQHHARDVSQPLISDIMFVKKYFHPHLFLRHPDWLAVLENFWCMHYLSAERNAVHRYLKECYLSLGSSGKTGWSHTENQHVFPLASHLTPGPESKWPPPTLAD